MLVCPICSNEFEKSILSHIRQSHNMTTEEFKKKFPESPLREAWMKGKDKSDPRVAKIAQASGDSKRGQIGSNSQLRDGAWSREHNCCVQCGTTDSPHSSNGLCKKCRTRQSFDKMEKEIVWTTEEETILMEKYEKLVPVKQIHLSIPGKTPVAVMNKLKELGVDISQRRTEMFRKHLPTELTQEEESVVFGSLLGDGSICLQKNNSYCFRESHGEAQADYLMWKVEKLERWGGKEYIKDKIGIMNTSYHKIWKEIYDKIYVSSKKRVVSDWWLSKIDSLAVAIWIADDGGKHGNGMRISTYNFDINEHKMFVKFFEEKFGVIVSIEEHRKPDIVYPYLFISADEYRKLVGQLPWQKLPECVQYKFEI